MLDLNNLCPFELAKIPEADIRPSLECLDVSYDHRDKYITKYGYSLPCKEAVDEISKSKKLIGIGSGTGYWEKILGIKGFDNKEGDYQFQHSDDVILKSAADAILEHPDHDVFCSWPTYAEEWFTDATNLMKKGRKLYYIGEYWGGCTASESFFMDGKFKGTDDIMIPRWPGIRDALLVFERL